MRTPPSIADYPYRENLRKDPKIVVDEQADGSLIITTPHAVPDYPASICASLYEHGKHYPDRVFLAERNRDGDWDKVTFGQMLAKTRAVAQWFINHGFDQSKPVMILSSNSINQAVLTFGAMMAGVPVAPVSPPYSLISTDFSKLITCAKSVKPAAIYVEQLAPFTKAISALNMPDVTLISACGAEDAADAIPFSALLATPATDAVEARFSGVTSGMIAKILFTSGSTGTPKAVINSHQNLSSVPAMRSAVMLKDPVQNPEILLDWLPWHHTFGGNAVLNTALYQASTLYLDDGKPLPGEFAKTIRNIIDVRPTQFLSVPAAFAILAQTLETNPALSEALFSRITLFAYGGAALGQDVYERMQRIAVKTCGERIHFGTGCGSTETGSLSTMVYWTMEQMGQIGLPTPGSSLKLRPAGKRFEMWIKGPQVSSGYLDSAPLNAEHYDDEGYYNTGDAVTWADANAPEKGFAFSGRISENFKLSNGTWVLAGNVRLALIDVLGPLIQDAVIVGQNKDYLGALVWPNLPQCRTACGLPADTPALTALTSETLRNNIAERLAVYNTQAKGAAARIQVVKILTTPPSMDKNEITDKRYVNQAAVLANRPDDAQMLYQQKANPLLIHTAPRR